jgi:hypothetical protein
MIPGARQPPTVRASAEARASSLSRTPDDPRVIAAMEEYCAEKKGQTPWFSGILGGLTPFFPNALSGLSNRVFRLVRVRSVLGRSWIDDLRVE